MKVFRRVSTWKLVLASAAAAALGAGAGVGVAVAGGHAASPPPPASLADAVHAALTAPQPDGVSGTLRFTNRLLVGAAAGAGSSPLLDGATGRFWVSGGGKARLELQAPDGSGDVEILYDGSTLEVYDVASATLYRAAVAQPQPSSSHTVPSVSTIRQAIAGLAGAVTIAGPTPASIAGEGAYQVRLSPRAGGGLLGGAQLAWDALHGVPLRLAVYATGDTRPVLELRATSIDFGPVPASDLDISPPATVRIVDLGTIGGLHGGKTGAGTQPVTGAAAVAARLAFPITAPDVLAGRQRADVRLVHVGGSPAAFVVYGQGLGAIAVLETQGEAHPRSHAGGPLGSLPTVQLATGVAARELPTALGTVVRFERGGVAYTVAASQPAATVIEAARTLAG